MRLEVLFDLNLRFLVHFGNEVQGVLVFYHQLEEQIT
jgi:hypothetical protein